MKNTLLALVVAVAVAACVQADEAVCSSNTVGYVKVTVPGNGGVCLIGLNLKRVNGAGPRLASEIFGTDQLEKGDEPGLADTVYVWNPGGADSGGYTTLFQRLDGTFCNAATLAAFDPGDTHGLGGIRQNQSGQRGSADLSNR
jgi:hypothetical protein